MEDIKVSVDGLTWRRPGGRYVDEIRFEELTDKVILHESDKDVVSVFTTLGVSAWQGTIDANRINAYELLDRLKQVVEDLLVEAGWEVHIVDSLKRAGAEDYLHCTGGALQVHEVPFTAEWNTELKLDELCNPDGNIRPKAETLAKLKERIGVETFDLEYETEDTRDHVLAILDAEDLSVENLHDVCDQVLTTGAQEFRWFEDEEEAEAEARVYLTDGDGLWEEAVAAGSTTDGLEEWAEEVLDVDGWERVISSYDGVERVAQLKDGTWFPYVRVN